jgi:hypothetical protein
MKKILLSVLFSIVALIAGAQCTTTNATSCQCQDNQQSNCDLLPNITVSWYGILNYLGGPNEYEQVCNPPCNGNDGRLRITASTPNIGHGPLTVSASTFYVCGTDTTNFNPGPCPDGSYPRQLIEQRIYHKNGSAMSSYTRWAGSMTYHPSHSHSHVDDWGVFTLRYQTSDPDPRNWPIAATGAKLGFCLMDYYQCGNSNALNQCKDVNTTYNFGNTMINNSFPNFGLGGGNYNCNPSTQGISSGYTDVYDETLDMMWINLPADLCNGQYWIVCDVDPNNNFLEEDETDNYTAVPYTLTQQNPPNTNPASYITLNKPSPKICVGESITLKGNGAMSYLWSTGDTTQSITVNTPGTYSVTTVTHCGTSTATMTIAQYTATPAPVATGDTVCVGGSATLTATGTGTLIWEDANGNSLDTGNTYITSNLNITDTFYVRNEAYFIDTASVGPVNNKYGVGANSTSANHLAFTTEQPIKIISVKVLAAASGTKTIELRDSSNTLIQTMTANVVSGWNTVTLNWNVPAGMYYRLGGTNGGVNLYRNNTNATNFPYTIPGVMSITGSSAGDAYYYYFYDWKVEVQNRACSSAPVMAIATVEICTSAPQGKDLSNSISVYPNPSNGLFSLNMALPGMANAVINVVDMVGKTVYTQKVISANGNYQQTIDLSGLAKGSYILNVNVDGHKPAYKRITIQ